MSDWKIRQEIYHRLKTDYDDDLSKHKIEITDRVVENATRYFKERDIGWIYPSKSYMVGICYAKWLADKFGGRPLEYLDDQDLLYNNDPYFVAYSKDPATYIKILESINGWDFNENEGMVPDVREYFNEEFMINE